MNNIQLTAIRLIANNFLFSREKNKESHGYRFDSSFLTKRGITSIKDMEALQVELNKRGWCFNILNFNDYVIQEKSFLAEMTKLGFGRVDGKSDEEVLATNLLAINDRVQERIISLLCKEQIVDAKDITRGTPRVFGSEPEAISKIVFKANALEITTTEDTTKIATRDGSFETIVCNTYRNLKEKLSCLCSLLKSKKKMEDSCDDLALNIKSVLDENSITELSIKKSSDYGTFTIEAKTWKDNLGVLCTMNYITNEVWLKFNTETCVIIPYTTYKKSQLAHWAEITIKELISAKKGV